VTDVIRNARRGVMPAWENRLSPETVKMLTVYVHALGGGQ
jgi:cytochrome c oxidase cbb3-type subunit 3